jgi:hypothetical protein
MIEWRIDQSLVDKVTEYLVGDSLIISPRV